MVRARKSTRSPAQQVPKYRVHPASGLARVTLSGRTHYLGKFNSPESREEYDRLIAEWLAAGRKSARPTEDEGPAVVEVILAYDKYAEEY